MLTKRQMEIITIHIAWKYHEAKYDFHEKRGSFNETAERYGFYTRLLRHLRDQWNLYER
jgi:hypothetical protein